MSISTVRKIPKKQTKVYQYNFVAISICTYVCTEYRWECLLMYICGCQRTPWYGSSPNTFFFESQSPCCLFSAVCASLACFWLLGIFPFLPSIYPSERWDFLCLLSSLNFNLDSWDLNSLPLACVTSSFTHWIISLAPA